MGAWERNHATLPWPAYLLKLYQQSTTPCPNAEKSFHLDRGCYTDTPTPCLPLCLFQTRGSKVISTDWFVECREHLVLLGFLLVIYLFQFPLCYQKVEKKKTSHLAGRSPQNAQDWVKFSIKHSSRILWGFTYESLKTSGMESQMCGHEVTLYTRLFYCAPGNLILMTQKATIGNIIRGGYLSQHSRFSSGSLTCTNPYPSSVFFSLLIILIW